MIDDVAPGAVGLAPHHLCRTATVYDRTVTGRERPICPQQSQVLVLDAKVVDRRHRDGEGEQLLQFPRNQRLAPKDLPRAINEQRSVFLVQREQVLQLTAVEG